MNILFHSGTDFFLTGGTALSRAYFNHRYSDDLDFFVNKSITFDEQLDRVLNLLLEGGFSWNTDSDFIRSEHYTTIKVKKDSEVSLKLDFVNDLVPIFGEVQKTDLFYRTDSIQNILSNKLSAIFRYEAKDVADIREIAIQENVDWHKAISQARSKDAGIDLVYVTQVLASIPQREFESVKWINKPDWDEFKNDLDIIIFDMLNG